VRRTKPKAVKSLIKTTLGPLEEKVMRAVCSMGRATVRDVVLALDHQFAYTTIMSTMDRLYHKSLLHRKTDLRAYVYGPAMTAPELDAQVAHDLINALLTCRRDTSDRLASELVDAMSTRDAALLDAVEEEIRVRRWQHQPHAGAMPPSAAVSDWPLGNA